MRDFYSEIAKDSIELVADDDFLFIRQGLDPIPFKGKFSKDSVYWDDGVSIATRDSNPKLVFSASSLPVEPMQGDNIEFNGVRYSISDPDVDEYYVYEVDLRKIGDVVASSKS